jgi:hypothetical protein
MRKKNRKIRSRKNSGNKTYSIIVDGETEFWYLQLMKEHEKENLPKIDIKPELQKKAKLKDQFEQVKTNSANYDYVFWLLDFDTINKEEQERKKGSASIIQKLKGYINTLQRRHKNVTVLVNNPCLEFWHLLHFSNTGKFYAQCNAAAKDLKKQLPSYQKTKKYYIHSNPDLYQRLKPLQTTAINNAKKLGVFSFENTQEAKAEIYQILELITSK